MTNALGRAAVASLAAVALTAACGRDAAHHGTTPFVEAPRNAGAAGSAAVTFRPGVHVIDQRDGYDALVSVSTDGSTLVFDRTRAAVTSVVLPMWRGRRGLAATIACGALGIATAAALWAFAVRVAVRPACEAYGRDRGMTYVDYKVYTRKRQASAACVLASPSGARHDVALPEAASHATDLWVGLAFSPELSIPACVLLFAVAWTRVRRGGREGEPVESRD